MSHPYNDIHIPNKYTLRIRQYRHILIFPRSGIIKIFWNVELVITINQ